MGNQLVQISTPGKTQTSESLTPAATAAPQFFPTPASGTGGAGKTFYIETFGCQMNVHDSEKVAGVLMARGYRPVEVKVEFTTASTASFRPREGVERLNDRTWVFRGKDILDAWLKYSNF